MAHLKLFLELAVAVVPEVAPGALAVVVVGPGLEKASLEGPSQRWVVPVVAVALAEPSPSAGVQAALDPSPLPLLLAGNWPLLFGGVCGGPIPVL